MTAEAAEIEVTAGRYLTALVPIDINYTCEYTYNGVGYTPEELVPTACLELINSPITVEWEDGGYTAEFVSGPVVNGKALRVGEYTVRISPTDKLRAANPDYDIAPCDLTFSITPLEVSLSVGGDLTKSYGDADPETTLTLAEAIDPQMDAEAKAVLEACNLKPVRVAGEEPGSYTYRQLSLNGGEPQDAITLGDFTFSLTGADALTIEKAVISIEVIDSLPYRGEPYQGRDFLTEETKAALNGIDITVQLNRNGLFAGRYTLTVTIDSEDANRYTLENANPTVHIAPAKLTVVLKDAPTYDGTPKGVNDFFELSGVFNDDDVYLDGYTTTYTTAGTHPMRLRLEGTHKDNYVLEPEREDFDVVILPIEGKLKVTTDSIVYDGAEHVASEFIRQVEIVDDDGNVLATLANDGTEPQYTLAFDNGEAAKTDVNDTAAITVTPARNYSAQPISVEAEITPMPVTFTLEDDVNIRWSQDFRDKGSFAWSANRKVSDNVAAELNAIAADGKVSADVYSLTPDVGRYKISAANFDGAEIDQPDGEINMVGNFMITFNAAGHKLIVEKADAKLALFTYGADRALTYDGEDHPGSDFVSDVLLIVPGADANGDPLRKDFELTEGVDYELSFDGPGGIALDSVKNAGEYTLRAGLLETSEYYGNVSIEPAGAEVSIAKAQAVIDVSGVETEYTYTGEKQVVDSGAVLNHAECELVYENNSFTSVPDGGKQVVTITAPATRNYAEASATVEITVNKAEAKIDVSGVATEYTYTGEKQTITGAALSHNECELVYENNSFTTVAEGNCMVVKITAEETQNYLAASATVEITVNKAEAKIDVNGVATEYAYTGEMQTVTGAALNHSECELVYENNSFTTVAEGNGKVVKITAEETANYLAAEAAVEITVNPAKPGDEIYPNVVYPTAGKLVYGQTLSESALTGGSTEIGSFAWMDASVMPNAGLNFIEVAFTPVDVQNFAWAEDDLVRSVEITVEPRPVSFTAENAEKIYGDADPEISVAISNPLEGDALNYTISRKEGEDAGRYDYIVTLGDNPNYAIDLLVGTLTILPRDISGKEIKVSGIADQAYAGSALRPTPTVKYGDTVLKAGVDYSLSYSNNVEPGKAAIAITGKGNFTGTRIISFVILPPAEEKITGEEAVRILNGLLGNDAGDATPPAIVFDADYRPESYELLDVSADDELQGNSLLVCAFPDEDGKVAQRSLILSAEQLMKLTQKQETEHIIFENGSAIVEMDMIDLLGGDVSRLMTLILEGKQEITPDVLTRDWSLVETAELVEAQLAKFDVEIRIVPVEMEDGGVAYEVSVWLRWDGNELDVSGMIPSLTVAIAVDDLVSEENFETFATLHAIVHQAPDGDETDDELPDITVLPSYLLLIPEHQNDTAQHFIVTVPDEENEHTVTACNAAAHPVLYRHCALATDHVGEGMYWVQKSE